MPRLTIRALCLEYRIDLLMLHRASSVHPLQLWDLIREVPMHRQEAGMVVRAINDLAHTHYSMHDLYIPLTGTET